MKNISILLTFNSIFNFQNSKKNSSLFNFIYIYKGKSSEPNFQTFYCPTSISGKLNSNIFLLTTIHYNYEK